MSEPRSKAPLTGSSEKSVPGSRNPFGTIVLGTTGPTIARASWD